MKTKQQFKYKNKENDFTNNQLNRKKTEDIESKGKVRSALLCICSSLCLLISGSFAYFTDQANAQAQATAGTLDLVFDDVKSVESKTGDLPWSGTISNLNPGDEYGLDFKLTNKGNKSMDVRQMITVESLNIDMTVGSEEFTIIGPEWTLDKDNSTARKLVYVTDDIIINGTGLFKEIENGGIDGDIGKIYDLDLVFAPTANNEFQNSNIKISYLAEAKQHRNTEEGWNVITKFETIGEDYAIEESSDNENIFVGLEAGLYKNDVLIKDWNTLVSEGLITVSDGSLTYINKTLAGRLVVPDSVKSIAAYALTECSEITGIDIPASVTDIADFAFYNCPNLTDINVTESNPNYSSVDGVLFNKNQTTLIYYPAGKSGEYTVPSSVTKIGNNAFANCTNLSSIDIPDSVTDIEDHAFSNCTGLEDGLVIPSTVTYIGASGFENVPAVYYPGNAEDSSGNGWGAIKYNMFTLYYDANGGTFSESSKEVQYNAKIGELPLPPLSGSLAIKIDEDGNKLPTTPRDSHSFMGWFDEDGNRVSAETVMPFNDITIYAHWKI